MSDEPQSVGQYIVALLAANGIDTVFGIPGVHNLEFYRGLAATGLRHILVRHEQNAGFAADGFARASGRPAAACVISGPGLTNILTSAAQAKTDSVPMLILASTPVASSLAKGWGVLHELDDQRLMAAGVVGTARSARSAQDARDHLREAFASFQLGRQRPAYLEVPLDLLAEPTSLRAERFARVGGGPQPAQPVVERAAALLAAASKPMIVAGGGAKAAGEQVRKLVEALDGYLVTTVAGKGLLPESHPANLGASLQFRTTQQLVAQADVVLAVGTELSETDFYSGARLEMGGRLIRIDIDATKLADHYAADVGIWGDAAASLAALSDIVYIAETAHFADPHVQIGLVAADGGPLVWGSQISLLQAKEFALTGVRIKAQRAVDLGLANHVVADPLAEAIACAKKILELPQQAVEATKRLMNLQLEKSVMASLDYANLAEYVSFGTADFNKIVDGLIAKGK